MAKRLKLKNKSPEKSKFEKKIVEKIRSWKKVVGKIGRKNWSEKFVGKNGRQA